MHPLLVSTTPHHSGASPPTLSGAPPTDGGAGAGPSSELLLPPVARPQRTSICCWSICIRCCSPRCPARAAALRSGAIVALTVALALAARHRLNAVFAVLGGSVGAALVCWFPAALLVADARGGIAAGSAWYVAATRGLLAAGLAALGVAALAGTLVTLSRRS